MKETELKALCCSQFNFFPPLLLRIKFMTKQYFYFSRATVQSHCSPSKFVWVFEKIKASDVCGGEKKVATCGISIPYYVQCHWCHLWCWVCFFLNRLQSACVFAHVASLCHRHFVMWEIQLVRKRNIPRLRARKSQRRFLCKKGTAKKRSLFQSCRWLLCVEPQRVRSRFLKMLCKKTWKIKSCWTKTGRDTCFK